MTQPVWNLQHTTVTSYQISESKCTVILSGNVLGCDIWGKSDPFWVQTNLTSVPMTYFELGPQLSPPAPADHCEKSWKTPRCLFVLMGVVNSYSMFMLRMGLAYRMKDVKLNIERCRLNGPIVTEKQMRIKFILQLFTWAMYMSNMFFAVIDTFIKIIYYSMVSPL